MKNLLEYSSFFLVNVIEEGKEIDTALRMQYHHISNADFDLYEVENDGKKFLPGDWEKLEAKRISPVIRRKRS